jgi:SNF family Na+-dependent transporter
MAERERWGGRLPFIMAAVGSAVGLGNVWRFPAVAYRNGGGAFLLPYFVALITAGIPLLIVEYTLGQKFQKGAPGALAAVNSKFRWVGWFALLVGSVISFYYVAIMAHAWHYTVASATLDWTEPAPIRVKDPINPKTKAPREGRVVLPDRVVLYLEYSDAEQKKRLEEVIGDADIELLSTQELEERIAPGSRRGKPALRYRLALKKAGSDVLLSDAALLLEREDGTESVEIAEGEELLRLSRSELDKRIADATKQLTSQPKYYPSREGHKFYVSLDNNAKNYFWEECLGGFAPGHWATYCAHNAQIDREVRALRKKDGEDTAAEVKTLEAGRISYLGDMFALNWTTGFWCAVTWLAIFLIIFKGVRIVGKVVMWTVTIPVVLLAILLVRGIMLEGSAKGIIYYLTPTWDKLTDPTVWLAAYGQIFFSLSLGFGILIAYASYKPRDSEVTNDAFITAFANCATSFFAAFAVFSVLGYLATINRTQVEDVLGTGGIGLAFVTYPVAIAKIGGVWGRVIGIVFFACLLLLGIDSAFSIVEGVLTGVRDRFPRVGKAGVTAGFCLLGFFCSLFFATSSGLMWLDIVDNWMSKYGLAVVGLLECIAVAYFFRHHEIEEFANERSEIKLGGWFELFIKYVTPAVLVFLLGAQFLKDMTEVYEGYDKILPWSVTVAGWGVFLVLVTLALALGRNWTKFCWLAGAAVIFLVFRLWFERTDVAAMAAAGLVLLFGGLFTCLRIALRRRPAAAPAPPAQGEA